MAEMDKERAEGAGAAAVAMVVVEGPERGGEGTAVAGGVKHVGAGLARFTADRANGVGVFLVLARVLRASHFSGSGSC